MTDPTSSRLLRAPLAKTLCALFDHLPDTYFFVKDAGSRFVHVNRALLERLGLREVSEIAGTTDHDRYSPHIARQLAEVGMGPRDFILKTRLHAAAGELRRGSEPIVDIAEKFGFCDQSAFTRQFRRILGATPARYRSGFSSKSQWGG